MGVLPLVFEDGTSWQTLGLVGDETVTHPRPRQDPQAAPDPARRDQALKPRNCHRAPHLPDRYARRARILRERRDSVLRAAAAGGLRFLSSRSRREGASTAERSDCSARIVRSAAVEQPLLDPFRQAACRLARSGYSLSSSPSPGAMRPKSCARCRAVVGRSIARSGQGRHGTSFARASLSASAVLSLGSRPGSGWSTRGTSAGGQSLP